MPVCKKCGQPSPEFYESLEYRLSAFNPEAGTLSDTPIQVKPVERRLLCRTCADYLGYDITRE